MAKKKSPQPTSFDRRLLRMVEDYEKQTGLDAVDLDAVVDYLELKGEFQVTKQQMKKKFRNDLARALSKDVIENENGEPVRRRQCYKTETQRTLWKIIDKMTPDEMRVSYQVTRRQAGGVVFQKQRDIDWYNKHVNPGDPIETSWNYDQDWKDHNQPTEYPEEPPPA